MLNYSRGGDYSLAEREGERIIDAGVSGQPGVLASRVSPVPAVAPPSAPPEPELEPVPEPDPALQAVRRRRASRLPAAATRTRRRVPPGMLRTLPPEPNVVSVPWNRRGLRHRTETRGSCRSRERRRSPE